jgi:hypothetical protein
MSAVPDVCRKVGRIAWDEPTEIEDCYPFQDTLVRASGLRRHDRSLVYGHSRQRPRATSGHQTAAPPRNVTNSRRLIASHRAHNNVS